MSAKYEIFCKGNRVRSWKYTPILKIFNEVTSPITGMNNWLGVPVYTLWWFVFKKPLGRNDIKRIPAFKPGFSCKRTKTNPKRADYVKDWLLDFEQPSYVGKILVSTLLNIGLLKLIGKDIWWITWTIRVYSSIVLESVQLVPPTLREILDLWFNRSLVTDW